MSNNEETSRFRKVLDALGIEAKPKTLRGKLLKGFHLVTIPLFFVILITKPYVEERNERRRLNREREQENKASELAKQKSEEFAKKYPEIQQHMDNMKKSTGSK
ncbi:hypothetical protein CYY_002061 [Polysphondylium violaceum]|uniref:Transmembrane protein n=1 Tax=Polysphondylium violaceum TaxID=133409 RepID=A0A8J4Q1Y0_9MYCE|nr:hypothetical protein CYY_002061 [Polysphondylium violaceum]